MVDYTIEHDAEELEKIRERNRIQEVHDLKLILDTPSGERFFKKIFMNMESIDCMTGNSWTFFKEGKRSFAKSIWLDVIEANPFIASKITMEVYQESKERTK